MGLTDKSVPRQKMRKQTHWLAVKKKKTLEEIWKVVLITSLTSSQFCQLVLLSSVPLLRYSHIFQFHQHRPIPGPHYLISAWLIVASFWFIPPSRPSPNTAKTCIYFHFSLQTFHFSEILLLPIPPAHTRSRSDTHAHVSLLSPS